MPSPFRIYSFAVHVFENPIFIRVCAKILDPKAKIDNFPQNREVLTFHLFCPRKYQNKKKSKVEYFSKIKDIFISGCPNNQNRRIFTRGIIAGLNNYTGTRPIPSKMVSFSPKLENHENNSPFRRFLALLY